MKPNALAQQMWGQEKLLTLTPGAVNTDFAQLVQVDHPHPESWRFYLFAQPVAYSVDDIWVDWQLANGVGTAVNQLLPLANLDTGFAYMRWQGPNKPAKWLGAVQPPKYDDTFATNTSESVSVIVGQTIYIAARIRMAAPVPTEIKVRVRAAVCPNVFGANDPTQADAHSPWRPNMPRQS